MKKVGANEADIIAFLEGIKLPADEINHRNHFNN